MENHTKDSLQQDLRKAIAEFIIRSARISGECSAYRIVGSLLTSVEQELEIIARFVGEPNSRFYHGISDKLQDIRTEFEHE